MRRPYYTIATNSGSSTAEIMIYGVIGGDYWSEGVLAKQFVTDFNALQKKNDRINIRVNGPGGSIWEGLAIFNCIAAATCDTHSYNDGIAFSMSAVILLAAKTVHVSKGSMAMLHNASGGCAGNAEDMRESADILDKHDKVLTSLIANKTGKTEDEVKNLWMNYKDNFLTAQEMIDGGLADVLEDYDAKDSPANVRSMSRDQIAAFYTERMEEPSESLLDKISSRITNLFPSLKNNSTMNFPKLFALVGVAKPTAEQVAAVKAELTAAGIAGYGLYPDEDIAGVETLRTENTRLTGELATAITANATAVTNATNLQGQLTSANATIAANATKIVDLEAKVEAFGKNAGAQHQGSQGANTNPDDVADTASIMDNLAHNKTADATFGVPKAKAAAETK